MCAVVFYTALRTQSSVHCSWCTLLDVRCTVYLDGSIIHTSYNVSLSSIRVSEILPKYGQYSYISMSTNETIKCIILIVLAFIAFPTVIMFLK